MCSTLIPEIVSVSLGAQAVTRAQREVPIIARVLLVISLAVASDCIVGRRGRSDGAS